MEVNGWCELLSTLFKVSAFVFSKVTKPITGLEKHEGVRLNNDIYFFIIIFIFFG